MSFWHILLFLILGSIAIFIVIKILNKYDETPDFKEEVRLKKLDEKKKLKQTEEFIKIIRQTENISNFKSTSDKFSLFKIPSNSFWHGHKGLALTFWVYFVGANILLNIITLIFAENSTILIFILIISVIWNVLSVMGVFNAANIYKAEKISNNLPYTVATVAKVAVVLLILSAIGNNIPR